LQQDLEEMESHFHQEQEELQKRLHVLESENEQVLLLFGQLIRMFRFALVYQL